jgi:hypothetical protein
MNVTLVIDPDTRNQQTINFTFDSAVEEIRWEVFPVRIHEKVFSYQDAYVGDSIYPALFLNLSTVKPHTMSIMDDGLVYVEVKTI